MHREFAREKMREGVVCNPKNRGRSKKSEGQTGQKSMGGSLTVGNYLQRGSPPPPPGHEALPFYLLQVGLSWRGDGPLGLNVGGMGG